MHKEGRRSSDGRREAANATLVPDPRESLTVREYDFCGGGHQRLGRRVAHVMRISPVYRERQEAGDLAAGVRDVRRRLPLACVVDAILEARGGRLDQRPDERMR